jgi:ABC-type transporter Mla maintaining outer membrane lipid asymmetry permease subunit MlaE
LTALADVVGLVAGAWVVQAEYNLSYKEFYRSVMETASVLDFT